MSDEPTRIDRGRLGVYLNDHRALAAGGIALARRCLGSNPHPPLGPMLSELIDGLEADKRLLETLMAALGIKQDRIKQAAVLVGERAARLKLNGSLLSYSPLSRLEELEGLRSGIYAKRALWESLLAVDGLVPDRSSIEAAVQRADVQIDRVEEARRAAAAEAFLRAQPR